MKNRTLIFIGTVIVAFALTGCFGSRTMSMAGRGGEVVGVGGGKSFNEPTPFGMVKIDRGYLHMGLDKQDSLFGAQIPTKDVSVDGFWMDETEVTNSKYKQFVKNVFEVLPRHALHAHTLGFIHPTTKKEMYFESPMPKDMQDAVEKWRNYLQNS